MLVARIVYRPLCKPIIYDVGMYIEGDHHYDLCLYYITMLNVHECTLNIFERYATALRPIEENALTILRTGVSTVDD